MADRQQMLGDSGSGSSSEYRKECHELLHCLKTTVEGLLALPSNNVWNTFGGLDRLAKSIESILCHKLKANQTNSQEVFWHFVRGLHWLNPISAPVIDRINRKSITVKGQQWLRETLESHNLSSQLNILVRNRQHLLQHYQVDAFLCQPDYFLAMLLCLNAVERNSPAILADINPAMLYQPRLLKKSSHIRSNSLPFITVSVGTSNNPVKRHNCADASQIHSIDGPLKRFKEKESLLDPSSDFEVRQSLYDAVSIETLNELSDSDHIIERISDPLMNFYATSSTEKNLKIGPSVSSENLDNFSVLGIPETPTDSALNSVNALPAQNLSFSETHALPVNQDSEVGLLDKMSKTGGGVEDGADNITIAIRQKVINRVKEHGSRTSVRPKKYDFSDIFAEELTNIDNNRNFEAPRTHKLNVLDLILNNDDLDIQSVHTDSGIESQLTQNSKSSRNSMKIENSVIHSSLLVSKGLAENAIVDNRSSENNLKLNSGNRLERVEQSNEAATLALSSSLPTASRLQKERTVNTRLGFFRPPQEGQSLLSFLHSQDFHTCADLDRESAHFSIAEALIAAVEKMKWNQTIAPKGVLEHEECDSDEEIQMLKQRIRIRRSERLKEKARQFPGCFDTDANEVASQLTGDDSRSDSCPSFETLSAEVEYSSSSEDIQDAEIKDFDLKDEKSSLLAMKESGLSLSMASLYSDADLRRSLSSSNTVTLAELQTSLREGLTTSDSHQTSADSIAISLLKQFSEKHLPKASELVWLVSERDAPQQLLPLPDSFPISPDDGENADLQQVIQQNRLRGNLDWAPPRPQIVASIHPKLRQSVVIARQNHRCAGCGSKVEKGFVRRYRYCEYLGKYFCQCCHTNNRAYIPGRILKKWDFGKYYVSHFAHEFLKSIYEEPVFSVESKSTGLYQKVPALEEMRDLRVQLHFLAPFIQTCKQTNKPSLDAIPQHWFKKLDEIHYYSLSELVQVKKKELHLRLKELISTCITHISQCLLCQGKGFICEICRNGNDIIFPFEIGRVVVCTGCRAAFHRLCYSSGPNSCPKCARISTRKQNQDLPGEISQT